MPRILKDEVTGKGGFEASFYRWKPGIEDPNERGGIEIFLRSNDLESYFQTLSGGRMEASAAGQGIVSGPKIYVARNSEFLNGWGGRDGILFDGEYYSPVFNPSAVLFSERNSKQFNAVFLTAQGLSKGVTFRLTGLYALADLQRYGELVKQMVNRIYKRCFKPMEMSVEVTRDVA
jgi:hypothetical protein